MLPGLLFSEKHDTELGCVANKKLHTLEATTMASHTVLATSTATTPYVAEGDANACATIRRWILPVAVRGRVSAIKRV